MANTATVSTSSRVPSPDTHGGNAQLRTLFNEVDTDNSGLISEQELTVALEQLGLDDCARRAREMVAVADTDNNQQLDYDEFLNAMIEKFDSGLWREYTSTCKDYRSMREIFSAFDDNSGSIGPDEFRSLCHELEPDMVEATINDALKELDGDGDGEISLDEFKTWWEAAMAGKAHFASIALRSYDQIFRTTRIREVVEGDPAGLLFGLPLARWIGTAGFVAGVGLNVLNIIKAVKRDWPQQQELFRGLRDGSFRASRAECLADAHLHSTDELSIHCVKYEELLDHAFVTVLVDAELLLLLVHVCYFLSRFAAIRGLRTDVASLASSQRWIRVASSFESLAAIPSASALKILPQIKRTPAQLKARFTMEKARSVLPPQFRNHA